MACRFFRRAFMVASALTAALAGLSPPPAEARVVARYGDWSMRCEQDVGAPSVVCALVQNVQAADRANVSLSVVFLRTADQQAEILRVLAPLGVLLPSGLGLTIDDNEVGLAGFVRCLRTGCLAEVRLDEGLVDRFEAGQTATFSIFQTPEEGIGIPISLNGFADGYAALSDPPTTLSEVEEPAAPISAETRAVERTASAAPISFEPPDDERTELDRLLEDELFPYVAAAAAGILFLLVLLLVLILRGRSAARRRANAPRAKEEKGARPAARREGPRAVRESREGPRAARERREGPRAARETRPTRDPEAERLEPRAPRSAPRLASGSETPPGTSKDAAAPNAAGASQERASQSERPRRPAPTDRAPSDDPTR